MTGHPNYAFNGLAALVAGSQNDLPSAQTIVRAISGEGGTSLPDHPENRLNGRLRGWAWFDGTFTWIEPTAWCLLALKRWRTISNAARLRVLAGEAVLRDRACIEGGWNYGNANVYGADLPAHAPTTAIGILALQDRTGDAVLNRALEILEQRALGEASTTSLALSLFAFSAAGRPYGQIIKALTDHSSHAVSFGNVAAMGMAAYALGCAATPHLPTAFDLPSRMP